MMLRSLARGWKVAVVQFVKSGRWRVGEEKLGRQLGVDWFSVGDGFTWDSADLDHDKRLAQAGWKQAADLLAAGEHHLVVLDELTYLCNWGWLDTDAVAAAVRDRPVHVNVVITGRDAPSSLVDVADTVTEMREIKHAYQRGIGALRGIDY
jgi:cob(I)alamin adenosyltransferase